MVNDMHWAVLSRFWLHFGPPMEQLMLLNYAFLFLQQTLEISQLHQYEQNKFIIWMNNKQQSSLN